MLEINASQIVIEFRLYLLIVHLDIFHLSIRRTMRIPNIQLILLGTQDMISQITVYIQICAYTEVKISPALVVVHLRHDISGRQQTNLFLRIGGDRIIRVIDRDLTNLRLFHHGKRIYLASVLHGRIILPFKRHLSVQVLFFRNILLRTRSSSRTQQSYHTQRLYIIYSLHRFLLFL